MNEQVLWAVRSLPREKLEDLAIRAMVELRTGRIQRAPHSYFHALFFGFVLGTLIAASGFIAGAALR